MHVSEFSLNQASLLSDGFFSVDPIENSPPRIVPSYPSQHTESSSVLKTLQRILNRLGRMALPGADQFEAFLRHVARRNRRPRTLCSLWQSNMLFLCMLKDAGRHELAGISRADVEAFIEREQDRGIKITTIRTRLVCVLRLPAVPGRGEGRLRGDLRAKDPAEAARAAAAGDGRPRIWRGCFQSLMIPRTGR